MICIPIWVGLLIIVAVSSFSASIGVLVTCFCTIAKKSDKKERD